MASELADLLACVAAFARSLEGGFHPQRFLVELSVRAQALVPHDGMLIAWLEDGGRSFSAFARHVAGASPRLEFSNYTIAFDPSGRFPRHAGGFSAVFDGQSQLVDDIQADDGAGDVGARKAWAKATGFRGRVGVPLYSAGRVIGALLMGSIGVGQFTQGHLVAARQIADLIGPFVENIVLLQRERRRRERLVAVTALSPILGASLKVGDVLEPLGSALRPSLDFDVLGLSRLGESGEELQQIAFLLDGKPVRPHRRFAIADGSFLPRVRQGEVVMIRDIECDLDRERPIDREIMEAGIASAIAVPLSFGDRVGGAMFFGKRRPRWYDESDAEIGEAVAAALVLAVQHQRLAEEQERAAVAEASTRQLEQRVRTLRGALEERFGFDTILGRSPAFLSAIDSARKVAPTETTVLLTGASGTGKEVLARAIHQGSSRADGPFIAVNCAALPETLIESELFGHERGAFTSADRLKRGRFELAAGGTLFLDEIGEMAPAVQAKLLRVLQERRFERVGGTTTLSADVRLVAATNRDLEAAVARGGFRDDLYYRLAVFRVHLPSLRERGDDILRLADRFVREFAARMGKGDVGLSREARDLLLAHHWPGNIRELQNAIERAVILNDGGLISAAHLGVVAAPAQVAVAPSMPAPPAAVSPAAAAPADPAAAQSLPELEKQAIIQALERARGNKSHAAAALGLTRTRFYTLLRRYRLG
jgi:transcriptional regulator with GAF, ATPase, and Fis domain